MICRGKVNSLFNFIYNTVAKGYEIALKVTITINMGVFIVN